MNVKRASLESALRLFGLSYEDAVFGQAFEFDEDPERTKNLTIETADLIANKVMKTAKKFPALDLNTVKTHGPHHSPINHKWYMLWTAQAKT